MIRLRMGGREIATWALAAAFLAGAVFGEGRADPLAGADERGGVAGGFLVTGSEPRPETLLGIVGKTVTGLVDTTVASSAARRNPWRIPRATTDRPDRKRGPQIHPIYLIPSDRKGGALDRKGVLDDSVRAISRWMRRSSGYKWRFDTFAFRPSGTRRTVTAIDVTYVESPRSARELGSVIPVADELTRLGFAEPAKRYLVYLAAPSSGGYCGQSLFSPSSDPNSVGPVAVVFLDGPPGCHARSFALTRRSPSWVETIAVHELLHNDGAVPRQAENDCKVLQLSHVCTPILVLRIGQDPEEKDVLFSYIVAALAGLELDLGRDDYFDHPHSYRDVIDSPYIVRAVRHQ